MVTVLVLVVAMVLVIAVVVAGYCICVCGTISFIHKYIHIKNIYIYIYIYIHIVLMFLFASYTQRTVGRPTVREFVAGWWFSSNILHLPLRHAVTSVVATGTVHTRILSYPIGCGTAYLRCQEAKFDAVTDVFVLPRGTPTPSSPTTEQHFPNITMPELFGAVPKAFPLDREAFLKATAHKNAYKFDNIVFRNTSTIGMQTHQHPSRWKTTA